MKKLCFRAAFVNVFIKFFQGILIGIGGILPGVSGGVLCVIFGIYRPLLELFANPFGNLKKYWRILLPVVFGGAVGFFVFARLISALMNQNSEYVICAFAGLTFGIAPSLYKSAGKQGRSEKSIAALFVGFFVLLGFLLCLKFGTGLQIEPNVGWYLFCGIVWGLSLIVPGLSSSTSLIFLGLYEPMMKGISEVSLAVIVPIAIGAIACVLPLSRTMNLLFEKFYSGLSHGILGAVLATAVMIIPWSFESFSDALLDFGFIVLGFALAFAMERFNDKYR